MTRTSVQVNCADAIPEMGTSAASCVFFEHARLCEKFPERVLTEQRYLAILGKFYINDQIVICTISTIYIAASVSHSVDRYAWNRP
jgi:hypothetical protein